MTNNQKEETKINWTPIIVGAVVLGGLYLVWKITQSITGGGEANREQAELILQDWQQEFDVVKPLVENMYSGGRTPTEQEVETLSSLLDQMKLKEYTIQKLSTTVWEELGEAAMDIAKAWGIIVGVPIAGYVAVKLVKTWTDKNKPPPNYPCPKCGAVFATEGALKYHIQTQHTVSMANATQAQQIFQQNVTWAQDAVAVHSGLYDRIYVPWPHLSTTEITLIVVAIAVVAAAALIPGAQVTLVPAASLVLA
jgi:hypothetical protein